MGPAHDGGYLGARRRRSPGQRRTHTMQGPSIEPAGSVNVFNRGCRDLARPDVLSQGCSADRWLDPVAAPVATVADKGTR